MAIQRTNYPVVIQLLPTYGFMYYGLFLLQRAWWLNSWVITLSIIWRTTCIFVFLSFRKLCRNNDDIYMISYMNCAIRSRIKLCFKWWWSRILVSRNLFRRSKCVIIFQPNNYQNTNIVYFINFVSLLFNTYMIIY